MTSLLASAEPTSTPVWAQLVDLFVAVCFVLALKGLSGPKTARNGNLLWRVWRTRCCGGPVLLDPGHEEPAAHSGRDPHRSDRGIPHRTPREDDVDAAARRTVQRCWWWRCGAGVDH